MATVTAQSPLSPKSTDGDKSFSKQNDHDLDKSGHFSVITPTSNLGKGAEGKRLSLTGRRPTLALSESDVPVLRRRSTFKGLAQSVTGLLSLRRLTLGRLSGTDQTIAKPKPKIENTFKTEPDKGTKFNPEAAKRIALKIIEKEMDNVQYSQAFCGQQAVNLASKIKTAIKEQKYPRYKIICQVLIGEIKDQGLESASRCVWDEKYDTYACVNYRNNSVFVNATIHGVYFE